MCGIAGYIGPHAPAPERVRAALQALAHRGPDGQGSYRHTAGSTTVSLLHRRLAILDLDKRSDQPFHVEGGVLVFNGEIYNYLELRHELETLGCRFRTSSDTEVLAQALRQWGDAALDKLEGMWAFAWYDEHRARLLLSRDRFGEKPLYLWRRDGGVYFASEIKGLSALAGDWPVRNENHLLRYLVNGYKAIYKTRETFYVDVEDLPLATSLEFTNGVEGVPRKYWTPSVMENDRLSYEDAVAETREAVISAVRLRMRSDVPLAFCMSGGIDSNTLISTARRVLGCDVHGFTIVNTDSRYDELELVQGAVRELGIDHTAIRVEHAGFLDNLRTMIAAHDSPVYTISYYVHWQLMRAIAANGYKVTISGTGADELFTGYYDHHNLYLHAVAHDPALHAQALSAWQAHISGIVRNPYLKDPDLYLKDPSMRDHIFLNSHVFAGWLQQPWAEPFTETDYHHGLLRNRMLNELFHEGSRVIVHEDDLNAMAFSMENRSPFLDRSLFELAYSIPVRHLIQNGRTKSVLRNAMQGITPPAILDNRRKVGFNAPILDLLDVGDHKVRESLLDDGPVYDIVRKDSIDSLLKRDTLLNSESKFLFNFINIKIFMEGRGTSDMAREVS